MVNESGPDESSELPYIAVKSLLGSNIIKSNPLLKVADNPFTDGPDPVVLVPAMKPDVAFLCMQRADRFGNAHYWGSYGLTQEASIAAEKIIVLADEIVDAEVIASDPSRVVIPGFGVNAVCHIPAACHPAPLIGRLADHVFCLLVLGDPVAVLKAAPAAFEFQLALPERQVADMVFDFGNGPAPFHFVHRRH